MRKSFFLLVALGCALGIIASPSARATSIGGGGGILQVAFAAVHSPGSSVEVDLFGLPAYATATTAGPATSYAMRFDMCADYHVQNVVVQACKQNVMASIDPLMRAASLHDTLHIAQHTLTVNVVWTATSDDPIIVPPGVWPNPPQATLTAGRLASAAMNLSWSAGGSFVGPSEHGFIAQTLMLSAVLDA